VITTVHISIFIKRLPSTSIKYHDIFDRLLNPFTIIMTGINIEHPIMQRRN